MVLSLIGALLPVLLGVGVALLPRVGPGVVGPTRTFALAAAMVVVLLEMLPSAANSLGPWALAVFGAAVLLPGLLEVSIARLSRMSPGILSLEISYFGLLLHQGVDGFGIGVAGQQAAVTIAIAAHSAPLVTAATLGYSARLGPRAAMWRGGGLLLATALGVLLGAGANENIPGAIEPWIQAALGGFLLHILGHDLRAEPPLNRKGRIVELGALGAGMLAPLGWMDLSFAGTTPDSRLSVLDAAAELGVESAPALLLGLLLGLPLQAQQNRLEAGAVGTLLGGLLRPESLILGGLLLGWGSTLWMVGLGLILAGLGARLGGESQEVSNPWLDHPPHPEKDSRWGGRLERRLLQQGPWWVVGLGLAAYAEAFLEPGSLHSASALLVVALFAAPSQLPPLASVPLATVLWGKGLPAEAALAFPILASFARFSLFRSSWRHRGARGPVGLLITLGATLLALWFLAELLPESPGLRLDHLPFLDHPLWEMSVAALLGLGLLGSIGKTGPRLWFATLAPEHGHEGAG